MKLSVALCTFNGEKFLGEQLHSILSQSVPVDEIIICDDKSTDNTLNLINRFREEHPQLIKIFINESNLNSIRNFEKAIGLCSGDIIFLSDQDDIWASDKVKILVDFLTKNANALLIFTNASLIDENNKQIEGTLWEKWGFDAITRSHWRDNRVAFRYLLRGDNKVTGATIAFKAELKKNALPFEIVERYWHDAWLSLFAAKNEGLYFLDLSLIKYRVHPDQLIGIGNGKLIGANKKKSRSGLRSLLRNLIRRVYRPHP